LVSQVKPGNEVQPADDEQPEGQDHFPAAFDNGDTTASADRTVPIFIAFGLSKN
jgi:hypothetical protein